uniref:Protein Nef n=1 Tax=Simian immunodeficiency virus TaxID=11723 RepID=Q2XVQ9_SIV|nr:nef protein [Simian immunodeficiency virus]APX43177.1 nef protein [Simian immunodeficiency virus]
MGSTSSKNQQCRSESPYGTRWWRRAKQYTPLPDELLKPSRPSHGGFDKAWRSTLTEPVDPHGPDRDWEHSGGQKWSPGDVVHDEGDTGLVGFPVCPQIPLRPLTYKLAVDLSHFLKNKGGLQGINYDARRDEILHLYLKNEHGVIDRINYTGGPGIRFPLLFGWLWELVPNDIEGYLTDEEDTLLLHPASGKGAEEDPHGENLMWNFNPHLAYTPGWEMARLQLERQTGKPQELKSALK